MLLSCLSLNMAHAEHTLLWLFGGSSAELEASMISLCTSFYDRVLVDPVMAVLFECRDVGIHARRLGLFLAMLCGGNTTYLRERCPLFAAGQSTAASPSAVLRANPSIAWGVVEGRHYGAKRTPLRSSSTIAGAGETGGPFTEAQRDAWLNR